MRLKEQQQVFPGSSSLNVYLSRHFLQIIFNFMSKWMIITVRGSAASRLSSLLQLRGVNIK